MYQRGILCPSRCLVHIYNLKTHLFNHRQVIIKCLPRFSGNGHWEAGQRVIAGRPMTRATAHRYSCEDNGLTTLRSAFDAVSNNYRWRRHNHFEAVLDGFAALEEQYILSARANIDGQDADG